MRLKLFGATVLSLGLLAGACANSSGDGSGDGGTGGTGSTGATGSTGTTGPTGADQVVLRIEQGGGFVPVQYHLTQLPMLTLYGDGRYVTPGRRSRSILARRFPALGQQRLTPEAIQLLIQAAIDAGLDADHSYTTMMVSTLRPPRSPDDRRRRPTRPTCTRSTSTWTAPRA